MRYLFAFVLLLTATTLAACSNGHGSLENEATSYLTVRNAATGAVLATGDTIHGTITMHMGDTLQLSVFRHVSDPQEGTTNVNVTADADYNSSAQLVATVGQNDTSTAGLIAAISPGSTVIDVVFRDDRITTNDDHSYIEVTVIP